MYWRGRSRRSHASMTQRREDKTTSSPEPRDSPNREPRRLWLAFARTQVIAALWALEHERFPHEPMVTPPERRPRILAVPQVLAPRQ